MLVTIGTQRVKRVSVKHGLTVALNWFTWLFSQASSHARNLLFTSVPSVQREFVYENNKNAPDAHQCQLYFMAWR